MTTPDPAKVRAALGIAFTGAGIAHVVRHEWFEQLVGGISMFVPRLRMVARWVNLSMLVPSRVPAIGQVKTPEKLHAAGLPPGLAPVRVLVQMFVIAATWYSTRPHVDTE